MKTTLNISDDILKNAMKASGMKSKTKLVNDALKEYAKSIRKKQLMDLMGSGIISKDFDIDKMRELENEEC